MTVGLNRLWTLTALLLLLVIIVGSVTAWLRYSPSQPIEISLPSAQVAQGIIYIGGAVTNPGFYPFADADSLEALVQAAGGLSNSANLSALKLYIPGIGEEEPQKIDINRAEAWLLEALPGIGQTLAERIVDYRKKNGDFRNTKELLKVAGISTTTYERIKHLITVAD